MNDRMKVTNEMVDRFLSWRLPEDFCPDGYIAFNKDRASDHQWPVGTNLFTATQAREMLESVFQEAGSVGAPKFTKGPWQYLQAGDEESPYNVGEPLTICSPGPGREDLANVYSRDDSTVSISRKEAIANARLIAAAPDLYLTLSYCLAAFEELNILPATKQLIIEAQAKARGIAE